MEFKKNYWLHKSRRLFIKYSRLEQFSYSGGFDPDVGFWGEEVIEVGTEDVKRYYIVDNKDAYKDLKYMLDLELKIRYNNTES